MFERRLKILLWILAVLGLGLAARLVQLQVVQADIYRRAAEAALLRPIRLIPCLRGRILDRTGRVLAEDQPAWDVCVPYGVLAGDTDTLYALAAQLRPDHDSRRRVSDAEVDELRSRISAMWPAIAEATGRPLADVAERRERIVQRVRRIREAIRDDSGFERRIAEEDFAHPVVVGLTHAVAVEARIALARYPWVRVVDSTMRRYAPEPSLGHVLGRLADPGLDDVFARDEVASAPGVDGVERLANEMLEGAPGRVREDIEGRVVSGPVPPHDGSDVRLTINAALQRGIYERLSAAVAEHEACTGAAAVVIDVSTREVLAVVSYPGYEPGPDAARRCSLQEDQYGQPLTFRAVAQTYPPGSIIKPLVAVAALSERVVDPSTTIDCRGQLIPGANQFRCLGVHGPIRCAAAIVHSCNVYFYTVGERLGVQRLNSWMEAAGLGHRDGTGLDEESAGRLQDTTYRADARNIAVGQGKLEITPLQAANMMATIASGQYRDVTLLRDDSRPRPTRSLGATPEALGVVRQAMFGVVHDPGGTAYQAGPASLPDPWVFFGKTGSAQAWARELDRLYTVQWPDGRREVYVARHDADLRDRLAGRGEYQIVGRVSNRRWPPEELREGVETTHAWFAGYVTGREALSRSDRAPGRAAAIAVVIEYAGHGGVIAAPVASDVARMVLQVWPEAG